MPHFLRSGFSHLLIIFVVAVLAIGFILSPVKRYAYMAYQNIGFSLGVNLNNIASQSYVNFIKSQNGEYQNTQSAVWLNQTIAYSQKATDKELADAKVLGDQTTADPNKWIEINLTEQKLYMHEGSNTVGSFLISSGRWAPTPTGTFAIWTKMRYVRMTGGNPAIGTYYDLPNVPYDMFFYQGYAIHGAYWHNNFGHPMSHGCINMRPEESAIVYSWASVGTKVVIHT